jgi:hypothetical protein
MSLISIHVHTLFVRSGLPSCMASIGVGAEARIAPVRIQGTPVPTAVPMAAKNSKPVPVLSVLGRQSAQRVIVPFEAAMISWAYR